MPPAFLMQHPAASTSAEALRETCDASTVGCPPSGCESRVGPLISKGPGRGIGGAKSAPWPRIWSHTLHSRAPQVGIAEGELLR